MVCCCTVAAECERGARDVCGGGGRRQHRGVGGTDSRAGPDDPRPAEAAGGGRGLAATSLGPAVSSLLSLSDCSPPMLCCLRPADFNRLAIACSRPRRRSSLTKPRAEAAEAAHVARTGNLSPQEVVVARIIAGGGDPGTPPRKKAHTRCATKDVHVRDPWSAPRRRSDRAPGRREDQWPDEEEEGETVEEPPSIAEQTEQWATNLRDGNRWCGRDGSRHGSRSPRRSPRGSSRRR